MYNNVSLRPDEELWICKQSCCRSDRVVNTFFKGQTGRRPQIMDILSPFDFKSIADVHMGSIPNPPEYSDQLRKLNLQIIPCFQDGVVIFVDPWQIDEFVKDILPLIHVKFVLMSGDSDDSNPKPSAWQILSKDTRMIHWFMHNYNLSLQDPYWNRTTPLPVGNSQWNQHKENLIKVLDEGYGLRDGMHLNPSIKVSTNKWILASFNVPSNPDARQPVWDLACKSTGKLAPVTTCIQGQSLEEHYKTVSEYKFVLSPHGLGLDCYRTWEALYLGTFPIVKTSSLDRSYENLPVLIVQDWEDIDESLLQETYQTFTSTRYRYEELYKGYWFDRVRSFNYPAFKYFSFERKQ